MIELYNRMSDVTNTAMGWKQTFNEENFKFFYTLVRQPFLSH